MRAGDKTAAEHAAKCFGMVGKYLVESRHIWRVDAYEPEEDRFSIWLEHWGSQYRPARELFQQTLYPTREEAQKAAACFTLVGEWFVEDGRVRYVDSYDVESNTFRVRTDCDDERYWSVLSLLENDFFDTRSEAVAALKEQEEPPWVDRRNSLRGDRRQTIEEISASLPLKEQQEPTCEKCGGAGTERYDKPGKQTLWLDCPHCRGTGKEPKPESLNERAMQLLDDYLANPDDLGEEWWDVFEAARKEQGPYRLEELRPLTPEEKIEVAKEDAKIEASLKEQEEPKCEKCRGTGRIPQGGYAPDGEPYFYFCDCLKGTGREPAPETIECPTCGGRTWIEVFHNGPTDPPEQDTCPTCKGAGIVAAEDEDLQPETPIKEKWNEREPSFMGQDEEHLFTREHGNAARADSEAYDAWLRRMSPQVKTPRITIWAYGFTRGFDCAKERAAAHDALADHAMRVDVLPVYDKKREAEAVEKAREEIIEWVLALITEIEMPGEIIPELTPYGHGLLRGHNSALAELRGKLKEGMEVKHE